MVQAYLGRSEVCFRKGDLDGVIRDSTKAIELKPGLAAVWNNRAIARQEKEDLDGALRDYDRSVRLNSKAASTYNNRGGARYLKQDFDGAISDQTMALKLDARFAQPTETAGLLGWPRAMLRVLSLTSIGLFTCDPRY